MENMCMSVSECANLLGVCRQSIYMIKSLGRAKFVKKNRKWFTSIDEMVKYKASKYSRLLKKDENGEPIFSEEKGLYSPGMVAEKFKIPGNTIYYLLRIGTIKHTRKGCKYIIKKQDVEHLFSKEGV